MTPSPSSATGRRARRRRRNAAASLSLRGSSGGASARALAAGLWRLRHAERMKAASAVAQAQAKLKARRRSRWRAATHLCHGNNSGSHLHRGILDKIDACVLECPAAVACSSMEKATKWDLDDQHSHHHHGNHLMVLSLEAELEMARGQVSELEEERRVMAKRLQRFLRKLAEEKAAWKARVRDKARRAIAALADERRHRRQLEQANAKLLRDLAEARSSARQQAQSYEAERKARELMEAACSELTREVEEDQAEVELLRRECLRMREDMEEERRMLQMAEVWREERVQMKLSDAKLALESKYTHLNRLQAEMEAFLQTKAKAGAPSASRRARDHRRQVDVFEHFLRRKERESSSPAASPASSSSGSKSNSSALLQSVSPATDLFLANIDDDDMYGNLETEYDGGRERDSSCSWVGTSGDRSAATEARSSCASRRSLGKNNNTALIRRLWRSAITESRSKTGGRRANGGGWSPASDRRSSVTAEALPLAPPPPPPAVPAVAGEKRGCSSGSGPALPQQHGHGHGRQSLKEKLMAARMHDQKPLHLHAVKQKP
ncbi:hypothetical protein BS78_02G000900 [Paspalum vaginatum]|nr:hypothetical protein BS78_02G000900 [Paspalum vaginatum]